LHHHFRSEQLTGEDQDEIAAARLLIGSSMETGIAPNHRSALTLPNEYGSTPLHYLFEDGFNEFNLSRYVSLIMDFSDEIDKEQSTCSYWNEILCKRNCFGLTPVHSLADNKNPGLGVVAEAVIRKSNKQSKLAHPLLCADNDGELPIHYVCDDTDRDLESMIIFLGIVGDENYNYRPTFDSVFCMRNDGSTPVTVLLHTFLCIDYISDDASDSSSRDMFDQFCIDNEWHSSDTHYITSFQHLLSSKRSDIDFSSISAIYGENLWPRFKVLLLAAMKSNIYHSGMKEKNYEITEEALHLAASVQNFPAFVLQLGVLNDPCGLLHHDQSGRIPLHYAIISTSIPGLCKYREKSLIGHLWESKKEPRTMVQYILQHAPGSANIQDRCGRLPIHLAINHGCGLESIIAIVTSSPQCIAKPDPITCLMPFMLAAWEDVTSLDVLFFLLQSHPSVMELSRW